MFSMLFQRKMLKTRCLFNISSAKCWKHYFPRFPARNVESTMFFNAFSEKCWKTQCVSRVWALNVKTHIVFFMISCLQSVIQLAERDTHCDVRKEKPTHPPNLTCVRKNDKRTHSLTFIIQERTKHRHLWIFLHILKKYHI